MDGARRQVMELRILVVEDSAVTRQMIRSIIQSRDWTICGEADNGWAGIVKFKALRPDVVVLDFTMPGINGIETARRMLMLDPEIPLILFTILDEEELNRAARAAGIYATVSKMRTPELVDAIESAASQGGRSNQAVG
jgi:two-component system, NarL family, invasion response regulator UvrY